MSRLFVSGTDSINCGSAASLDNVNVFTWCAWIYCTSNGSATRYIITKGLVSGKSIQVDASNVNGGIDCICEMSGATCRARNNTTADIIPQNAWKWICFQVTSGFVGTVYTASPGGVPTEISYSTHTTGTGSPSSEAASSFLIGGDATNAFPGRIAEVMMFNVNLTQGDRIAAMNGFPVRMGNLVGYWPLQGQTTTEPDFSGGKNTGTVTGAAQAQNPPIRNRFANSPGWQGAFTAAAGGGAATRGTPFGHRGTAFNGGRTFHGIIQ